MKRLTLQEAREQIKARELWLERQWQGSAVSNELNEREDDYLLDALFDIPNR